jgi:predicted Rossmann-fold nucleotide-binding protein
MVRGENSIRHHVRRKVRHGVMVNRPRTQNSDSPKALVAFPGGYGTLDKVFEVLTLIQTRKIKPIPVVLVGESYWREAVNLNFLLDEGVVDQEDRELFWDAETAEETWNGILRWHDISGEPLQVA